jgi:hypothetical protein
MRFRAARLLPLAAVVAASACLTESPPGDEASGEPAALSEAFLLEYATTPYKKAVHGEGREVLGKLNDVGVVVDFICGDVCPDATVRIIHFDVEPGPQCTDAGGVERSLFVPVAFGVVERAYCFPGILIDHWDAYVR